LIKLIRRENKINISLLDLFIIQTLMNDFLNPNLKKDKGFIFIDLSQKGQKRTRKGLPLEIFWSFCPFKTQNQKNAFSNGVSQKGQELSQKGQELSQKGQELSQKGQRVYFLLICPKKDKKT